MTAPVLSASLCHTLLSQSPRHAWWQSPALNPAYVREESDAFDLGNAEHAYVLKGETNFVLIDAPDFRTKLAKEMRDTARAEGKTPLLAHRWATVQLMAAEVWEQLARHDPPGLLQPEGGMAEVSIFFELDGVACRATPDWLSLDHRQIVDLKTVGASAHPAAFSRALWDKGYAIQAAFYRRAVKAAHGVDAEFRFVAVETTPPYALSVVALDPEAQAFADLQVTEAVRVWKQCLTTGQWPAYPTRTAYAEVPPWMQTQWLERQYYGEGAAV